MSGRADPPPPRVPSCRPAGVALAMVVALAVAGCVTGGSGGPAGLGASADAGPDAAPGLGATATMAAMAAPVPLDGPALFVAGAPPAMQWRDVLARHRDALADGEAIPADWTALVGRLQGLDLPAKLAAANAAINRYPYIRSERNWGRSDYWAAPFELMAKGGQCQDFAVAKYLLLRAAGVPADRLRVALVQDGRSGIAHAVLLAEVQGRMLVLDNQEPEVVPASRLRHYGPLYALSEAGWWLYDGRAPGGVMPAAGFDRGSFGRGS